MIMRKSITQEIYEAMRNKILTGELLPGQRILERELQQEFGASNSPIREAIRLLCASGFAETVFNKGAIVIDYTDIHRREELYEARTALEYYCAGKLASEKDPGKMSRIREAMEEFENVVSVDRMNRGHIIDADEAFHSTLVELAGNKEISSMYKNLFLFSRSAAARYNQHSDDIETIDDHRKIYEAIQANDIFLLSELIRKHLMVK